MPEPAPGEAALKGLCPRCGERTLFAGWLTFRDRCPACGLEFARFNVGDGATAMLILVIGAIVVGLAIWLQVALSPPWWVHVILWVPFATALTIGSLRLSKALMLALEYRHRAGEGRLK